MENRPILLCRPESLPWLPCTPTSLPSAQPYPLAPTFTGRFLYYFKFFMSEPGSLLRYIICFFSSKNYLKSLPIYLNSPSLLVLFLILIHFYSPSLLVLFLILIHFYSPSRACPPPPFRLAKPCTSHASSLHI